MQDVGKVGRHAQGMLAHAWATVLLQWSALLLCVAYLASTSVGGLTPVSSRVIRWASTRHKPALSTVVMAKLVWTGHGQAQRLWAGAQALICKQALRLHPATYGNLGRDQGVPLATWDSRRSLIHGACHRKSGRAPLSAEGGR